MAAPKRFPYWSKVFRCRSGGSCSASSQFRRKVRLGWLVMRTSMSPVATPSRRHRSVTASGTRRLPRARTLATLESVNPIRNWDSPGSQYLRPSSTATVISPACSPRCRVSTPRTGVSDDLVTYPTPQPSPGTAAWASLRTSDCVNHWPAALCALQISAVRASVVVRSCRASFSMWMKEAQPALATSTSHSGFRPNRRATSVPAPTNGRSGSWLCTNNTSTPRIAALPCRSIRGCTARSTMSALVSSGAT